MDSDSLRVLRNIHERGLTVTWRYLVPSPEFGDGEAMTREDWHIAYHVLGKYADQPVAMPHGEVLTFSVWESDYLTWEHVEHEEWHVINRAVLTDKAIEIAEGG